MSDQLPHSLCNRLAKSGPALKAARNAHATADSTRSVIDVDPAYLDAFLGLEEGRHIAVLYWFDRADRTQLQTTPPKAEKKYGVFATRSPHRPNPIALSTVKILSIDGTKLTVSGLDCIDGTPLLDIKIYVPMIDAPEEASTTLPWANKH